MILKCLFIVRHGECSPELLVAWDEFSIDENPTGFQDVCEKEVSCISDIDRQVMIEIEINDKDIMSALFPVVQGKIRENISESLPQDYLRNDETT